MADPCEASFLRCRCSDVPSRPSSPLATAALPDRSAAGDTPALPGRLVIDPVAAGSFGRPVRRRWGVPLALLAGLGLVLALAVLHDHVRYYRVTSGSMAPTLGVGARVAAQAGLPVRVGEIVVFDAPAGALPQMPVCGAPGEGEGFVSPCGLAVAGTSHTVLVKRIVAGPGDLVAVRDGRAVVNGSAASDPVAAACWDSGCSFPRAVRVPPGEYFLLGDNRAASDDSRFWGPVPAASILGVVVTCHPLQTACTPLR